MLISQVWNVRPTWRRLPWQVSLGAPHRWPSGASSKPVTGYPSLDRSLEEWSSDYRESRLVIYGKIIINITIYPIYIYTVCIYIYIYTVCIYIICIYLYIWYIRNNHYMGIPISEWGISSQEAKQIVVKYDHWPRHLRLSYLSLFEMRICANQRREKRGGI